MSTSQADGLAQVRRKAFSYLPGAEFDEVLAKAREYHEMHPVADGIREPKPGDPHEAQRLEQTLQRSVVRINEETLKQLEKEHREKLIRFFQDCNVPSELAGEIVDCCVLTEDQPA